MLTLLKIVRKIFKQIKSDMTPTQLGISISLGIWMGLTPVGIHWFVPLLLAFLFNCSMSAFLLVCSLLKGVHVLIAPFAFELGTMLLGGAVPPAEWVVGWLVEAPFFAWMGFDRYLMVGSYALALPLAILTFFPVRRAVSWYRFSYIPRLEASEKFQKVKEKGSFRLVRWMLAGKEKTGYTEKKRFLLFRPFRAYMIVMIPLLIGALSVGMGMYVQMGIEDLALAAINKELKVKSKFESIEYDFFGQNLSFTMFELPDQKNPKEDLVRVGSFEGDIGFLDLLAGRIRLEKLAVSDIHFHMVRDSDGSLNVEEMPGVKPEEDASAGEQTAWGEFSEWLRSQGKDVDWVELYKKYMAYRAKAAEEEANAPEPEAVVLEYDPETRWRTDKKHPFFAVDLIEVNNVQIVVSDRTAETGLPSLTNVSAKGTSISTKPGWDGKPLMLSGEGELSDGKSGRIQFEISFGAPTGWTGSVAQVPLNDLKAIYGDSLPVVVQKGSVTLASNGTVKEGAFDSTQNLQIDGLQIAARQDRPTLFGLNAETSRYVIEGINAYGEKLPIVVGVAVDGPVGSPQVHANMPFLDIAKKGLEMMGRKELQKHIDAIGGQMQSLQVAGLAKVAPLQGDFLKTQNATLDAIKAGDISGVKKALEEGKVDVKKVQDIKKEKDDLKKKKDDVKEAVEGIKDLFKKKKD